MSLLDDQHAAIISGWLCFVCVCLSVCVHAHACVCGVRVRPCSSQDGLPFSFGIASVNLFLGRDDRKNAGLCRLILEEGGEGGCLGDPCLTLAAPLLSHPACHLTEWKTRTGWIGTCLLQEIELFVGPAEVSTHLPNDKQVVAVIQWLWIPHICHQSDGSRSFVLLPVRPPPSQPFFYYACCGAVLFSLRWQTEVNVTLEIPHELLPLMKLTVKSSTRSSLQCIHLPLKYSHLAFSACFKGLLEVKHFSSWSSWSVFFLLSALCFIYILCLFYAFIRGLSSRPPVAVFDVHFPQVWLFSIRRRLKVAASRKVKEDYVNYHLQQMFLFKNCFLKKTRWRLMFSTQNWALRTSQIISKNGIPMPLSAVCYACIFWHHVSSSWRCPQLTSPPSVCVFPASLPVLLHHSVWEQPLTCCRQACSSEAESPLSLLHSCH